MEVLSLLAQWLNPPTPTRVYEARAKALTDTRFFRVCTKCLQRHPRGHMHSKTICHSCAETHLGVTY